MIQRPKQDERLRFTSAGIEFTFVVGVGVGGGYWLDTWLHMLPLCTLTGLAAGFALALWRLIRQVRPDRPEDD